MAGGRSRGRGRPVRVKHTSLRGWGRGWSRCGRSVRRRPWSGFVWALAFLFIIGTPPFGIFFSELLILISGFSRGLYLASGLYLFFIAIIFGGILYHFTRILFGEKPKDMSIAKEGISAKTAFIFLFILMAAFGIAMPGFLNRILISSIAILQGV